MRIWIVATFILMLLAIPQCLESRAAVADPLASIMDDFHRGRLTADETALLTITAIKSPGKLPASYAASLATGQMIGPCPSMAIEEVLSQWDQLQPATKAAWAAAFARPETQMTYVSLGGFFSLHYDTTGSDAVPLEDLDLSDVPDFVEKLAAYFDTALTRHQSLGYLTPPSDNGAGGDNTYDIYFDSMFYYGYCYPEASGPAVWNDRISYIVVHNTFLGFPPNDDPEGDQYGAAKATAAHEFHHAVQWAYDYADELWFQEMDATYIEDIIFDASNDNYNYLAAFFSQPEVSLMQGGPHAYSCFHFGLFMAQAFDTSLMRAAWEGSLYTPVAFQALMDTLLTVYGWTADSAMAEFALWNFCTWNRDDGLHFEEAAAYPPATIGRSHYTYPVPVTNSPSSPAGYAATYVAFYPTAELSTLKLTFNGSDSRQWAAFLIKSTAENRHQFQKIDLAPVNQAGTAQVLSFENYYRVVLVGVNVSEYSSSALFSYSAELTAPYDADIEVLTRDSSVYSGGERSFECLVTNPSPLNDVYNLIVWDQFGWIPPDTSLVPVLAHADTVVRVPVDPPVGTPLDEVSELYFKVVSWGDSTVTAIDTGFARTVLYRGDVDFSGAVDIADLVYMVSYFFGGGPPPKPVREAADHDCSGAIDIADMVHLVTFMFQGGEPCPCNPYQP